MRANVTAHNLKFTKRFKRIESRHVCASVHVLHSRLIRTRLLARRLETGEHTPSHFRKYAQPNRMRVASESISFCRSRFRHCNDLSSNKKILITCNASVRRWCQSLASDKRINKSDIYLTSWSGNNGANSSNIFITF